MNPTKNIQTQALETLREKAKLRIDTDSEAEIKRKRVEHLISVLEHLYQEKNYAKIQKIVGTLFRDKNSYKETLPNEGQQFSQQEAAFNKLIDKIKYPAKNNEDVLPNERSIKQYVMQEKEVAIIPKHKNFLAICYGDATSFDDYCQQNQSLTHGVAGKWISIVRSNDKKYLLFSDIEISEIDEKSYTVKMGNRFFGKGRMLEGSLQLFLENDYKYLLLSFFVGNNPKPQLLKGTFGGVATNGSPIAGLELLVRPELLSDLTIPCKFELKDAEIWTKTNPALKKIFENFEDCYLKIDSNEVYFDWRDL